METLDRLLSYKWKWGDKIQSAASRKLPCLLLRVTLVLWFACRVRGGGGGGGGEKVIFGFAWSFDPTLHVSLQFRRLRLKNFGLKLTLLAIWVYNWCSREMKNKHTGTLNTSINCCITRNQHYKTAIFRLRAITILLGLSLKKEKCQNMEYHLALYLRLRSACRMPIGYCNNTVLFHGLLPSLFSLTLFKDIISTRGSLSFSKFQKLFMCPKLCFFSKCSKTAISHLWSFLSFYI